MTRIRNPQAGGAFGQDHRGQRGRAADRAGGTPVPDLHHPAGSAALHRHTQVGASYLLIGDNKY